jgi:hypothetical protein
LLKDPLAVSNAKVAFVFFAGAKANTFIFFMAMTTWWQRYVTKDVLAGTIRDFVESIDPLPLDCCFCALKGCENCRMQELDTDESYAQEIVRQVNAPAPSDAVSSTRKT